MAASLDTDWSYRSLQVVRLENEFLCVDVLPQLGAKVWSFVLKPFGRNLLWHNPHLPPARQAYGARFDDNWSGGWDELIPNDVPTPVGYGDLLPDHGEVWSQEADVEVLERGPERASVRFTTRGRVWPTRFEKTLTLDSGERLLRVGYRYANLGATAIDFLWNIHPALSIGPTTRLDLPARRGFSDPWSTDRFDGGTEFEWPHIIDRNGQTVDLREVPPPGSPPDHLYLPDVAAGWYAATDTAGGLGFGMVFPTSVFPHLWLFRPLGSWRGLYTLIVEISTGYPSRLEEARQNGRCYHLPAGQALEAEVLAVAYQGVRGVRALTPDGQVLPGEA